jgi:hypothetical protein
MESSHKGFLSNVKGEGFGGTVQTLVKERRTSSDRITILSPPNAWWD